MQPIVRMARGKDLKGLLRLAALTGGGMTNLPDDHAALADKIAQSERSCLRELDRHDSEFYLFVLEDLESEEILGTCSIHSRLGTRWPFFSFRESRITHSCVERNRTYSARILSLVNDFDGCAEVGGLFLHPDTRAGGLGSLLARSRYLFIRQHRNRFPKRIIGDLRGWTKAGRSPFWDAVGRHFFGCEFHDADLYNSVHGNQFIADLMPRYPIYVDLLPADAKASIGKPHENSLPAQKMLSDEGFAFDGYVDIFDAGPTLSALIDELASIRDARLLDHGRLILQTSQKLPLEAHGFGQEFKVAHLAN